MKPAKQLRIGDEARRDESAIACPLCAATDTRSTGPVRLASGAVAEGRQCSACGERWTIDDAGEEIR